MLDDSNAMLHAINDEPEDTYIYYGPYDNAAVFTLN